LRALIHLHATGDISRVGRGHLDMLLRSILRTPAEDGAEGIMDDVGWVLAECKARFGLALDQGLLITLFMVRVWWPAVKGLLGIMVTRISR
jgi:hypothetical protein